jgi:hypothetical protein
MFHFSHNLSLELLEVVMFAKIPGTQTSDEFITDFHPWLVFNSVTREENYELLT